MIEMVESNNNLTKTRLNLQFLLRFADRASLYGGKVVSLKHRPPLPPGNALGTDFC